MTDNTTPEAQGGEKGKAANLGLGENVVIRVEIRYDPETECYSWHYDDPLCSDSVYGHLNPREALEEVYLNLDNLKGKINQP